MAVVKFFHLNEIRYSSFDVNILGGQASLENDQAARSKQASKK
jgi:hypothetical protein